MPRITVMRMTRLFRYLLLIGKRVDVLYSDSACMSRADTRLAEKRALRHWEEEKERREERKREKDLRGVA